MTQAGSISAVTHLSEPCFKKVFEAVLFCVVVQFQSSLYHFHGERSKVKSGALKMVVLCCACMVGLTTVAHSTPSFLFYPKVSWSMVDDWKQHFDVTCVWDWLSPSTMWLSFYLWSLFIDYARIKLTMLTCLPGKLHKILGAKHVSMLALLINAKNVQLRWMGRCQ